MGQRATGKKTLVDVLEDSDNTRRADMAVSLLSVAGDRWCSTMPAVVDVVVRLWMGHGLRQRFH